MIEVDSNSTILQQLFRDKREEKIELMKAIAVGTDEFKLTPLSQVYLALLFVGCVLNTRADTPCMLCLSNMSREFVSATLHFACEQVCLSSSSAII
jgi:hypothetical protein